MNPLSRTPNPQDHSHAMPAAQQPVAGGAAASSSCPSSQGNELAVSQPQNEPDSNAVSSSSSGSTWAGGFIAGGISHYSPSITTALSWLGADINKTESSLGAAAAAGTYNLGPWIMYNYSGTSVAYMALFGVPSLPAWAPILAGVTVAGTAYGCRIVSKTYAKHEKEKALDQANADLEKARKNLRQQEADYLKLREPLQRLETLIKHHRNQPLKIQAQLNCAAMIELREAELKSRGEELGPELKEMEENITYHTSLIEAFTLLVQEAQNRIKSDI